jgi:acetoin utilization protein AcuB
MSTNVEKYMTKFPYTVNAELSLEQAEKMMHEHRVRHLPVLKGGQLVGILSERDIQMVETFVDVNPKQVKISEAYTPDVYTVEPSADVKKVMAQMAEHKYGCALVVHDHKLQGVFTWIDALKAAASLIP